MSDAVPPWQDSASNHRNGALGVFLAPTRPRRISARMSRRATLYCPTGLRGGTASSWGASASDGVVFCECCDGRCQFKRDPRRAHGSEAQSGKRRTPARRSCPAPAQGKKGPMAQDAGPAPSSIGRKSPAGFSEQGVNHDQNGAFACPVRFHGPVCPLENVICYCCVHWVCQFKSPHETVLSRSLSFWGRCQRELSRRPAFAAPPTESLRPVVARGFDLFGSRSLCARS